MMRYHTGLMWTLLAALAVSLALLLFPEPVSSPLPPEHQVEKDPLPQLAISSASVRAFNDDGTPAWFMQSPKIDVYPDGRVEASAPRLLLSSASGADLHAQAGQGRIMPASRGDAMELYATVHARLDTRERRVTFSSESLHIADGGKRIEAPQRVRLRSQGVDTEAANLELILDEQRLLLGSDNRQSVLTRIQPLWPLN